MSHLGLPYLPYNQAIAETAERRNKHPHLCPSPRHLPPPYVLSSWINQHFCTEKDMEDEIQDYQYAFRSTALILILIALLQYKYYLPCFNVIINCVVVRMEITASLISHAVKFHCICTVHMQVCSYSSLGSGYISIFSPESNSPRPCKSMSDITRKFRKNGTCRSKTRARGEGSAVGTYFLLSRLKSNWNSWCTASPGT